MAPVASRACAGSGARVDRAAPNERATLPLSNRVRSVAVIGLDASEARLGGYSGPGNSKVSILDAIRARIGRAGVVRYARPRRITRDHVVVPAAQLSSMVDGRPVPDGAPSISTTPGWRAARVRRVDPQIDFG
jgi:beta-glucosidase